LIASVGIGGFCLDWNIVLLVILSIVLLVAIYLEFKYLRPKRRDDIELVLKQDDAYNAISSTKAVSASLKTMGKDTVQADALMLKADMEYDRKDYVKAIATAKAARDLLIRAKDVEVFEERPQPTHGMDAPYEDEPVPEQKVEEKTVHEIKKLPPNYLESKFLIETTKEDIEKAKAADRDCSVSEAHLSESEKCFEDKDYAGALRCCMKAKRALEGRSSGQSGAESAIKPKAPEKETVEALPAEPRPQETQAPEVAGTTCQKCGASANEDDNFCPKCGNKIVRQVNCGKCGSPVTPDDTFCRKCGEKLG